MAHAFNSSTLETEADRLYEFEASLVYRVSSWMASATQRNAVSKSEIKIKFEGCMEMTQCHIHREIHMHIKK